MPNCQVDREAGRVFAAEGDWRDLLHEHPIRDLELGRLHLSDHLPPPLLERCSVVRMQDVAPERRCTLAETEPYMVRGETFRGPGWHLHYHVRLGLPITAAVIMHEAAHVLLYSIVGEHTHGPEFRQLMLWLARPRYGAREAKRLERMYEYAGLTTGGGR